MAAPSPSPARPTSAPATPIRPGSLVLPDWLLAAGWSFPLSGVAVGDEVAAVTDTGPPDAPAVLLVHVGLWSFLWRDVVDGLRPHARVVTLDVPGTGLASPRSRPTIASAALAVDAVVRRLDLRDLTLVGHDLGGPVALHAAAGWPERIRGLVAINSYGWRPQTRGFRTMLGVMGSGPVRESDAWTAWLTRATSTRFGAGRHWDRTSRVAFRRGLDRRRRRSFHRVLASARTHDYGPVEAAVEALADRPLLTIFGARNDPLHFQPQWAARFADHTAIVVPTGHHFPMTDDPSAVVEALRTFR